MNQAMVMPISYEIDDAQVDIHPFASIDALGVLALTPPYVPGQFEDIDFAPAEIGVNLPMLYISAQGLMVLVQAYLNMAEEDGIRLYLGSNLVASWVLPADHRNLDVVMHIAADRIQSGVHTLRYEIRRKSGQPVEGAQVQVWFKIDPPGGVDPEPDLPGHQRLKAAQLQLAPGQVIDEELAAKGVTATVSPWSFMTKGDDLAIHFHGIVIHRRVLESEVGKAIDVFISPQVIAQAGFANPAVVVYQIKDQVENVSAFSERTTVVSDPGTDWLDRVFVPLADDEDQVSLDEIGFDPLTIQIFTRTGFALKERLLLRWRATTQSGEVVEHAEEKTITRLAIESFEIPNLIVLKSASGQVQVDYQRTRVDGRQDPSERYLFEVIGKSFRLSAPEVPDLVAGILDPVLAKTVVMCGPDARIKKGFRVTLTWEGTTASGRPHLYQTYRDVSDRLEGQPIAFDVAARDIAPLTRGSINISYEVSHASLNPALVSKTLRARVGDPDGTLPAPTVNGVVDGVLDPANVPYGTDLKVAAAAFTQLGDVVHVEGRSDVGGSVFRDRLLIDHGKSGKDLEFRLDIEAIRRYQDQLFSLVWWIERPDSLPRSSAILELYIGDRALALQAPTVRRAPGDILDPLENNKGARARVHLANPRVGDEVLLRVKGAPGAGSPVFTPQPVGADNRAIFPLTAAFIAQNKGRQVALDFDLLRGGKSIPSPVLTLTVQKVGDGDTRLVRPVISEAGGSTLIDLRLIESDLTCFVAPELPLPVVGQKVWIILSGSKSAALRVRNGDALTAIEISEGIKVKAERGWFAALDDLSECVLTCRIALGTTDTEATALVLPQTTYTVKVTSALAIVDSPMVLNGRKLIDGSRYGLRERDVPNNTQVRLPSGGRAPYTYEPVDRTVVTVDSSGKVSGIKNGSTIIVVKDASGQSVSFPVSVSNVYRLLLSDTRMTPSQVVGWFNSVGALKLDNYGEPAGWGLMGTNFVDVTPVFGGRGLYYGRFVSQNLSYPGEYVIEHSLLESNGCMGSRNVRFTDYATTSRAMAYIPT